MHHTAQLLGLTFNVDTIWSTLIAGVIVLGLGLYRRQQGDLGCAGQAAAGLGDASSTGSASWCRTTSASPDRNVIQLAIMLFTLILLSNWLELIPSQHYLPAPDRGPQPHAGARADRHLRRARAQHPGQGLRRATSSTTSSRIPVLFPLNLIEEIVKPFTLALRLFGNIFAGGLMLSIIGLIPVPVNWPLQIVWKLFDMAIGGIQAFIFALLTVLYYAEASESHADEDDAHARDAEARDAATAIGDAGSAGAGRATVRLPEQQPRPLEPH